ncbi:MAG: FtsX-like permease family protein [Vicinamibacterales bacterium]
MLGRVFTADEDRPGAPRGGRPRPRLRQRRFAGRRDVVGQEIRLNAEPYTVIGVLPSEYRHIEEDPDRAADVFLAWNFDPADANRGGHFIRAVARLAPGATLDQARAELVAIAARLERDFPTSNHGMSVEVAPLLDALVSDVRRSLLVLAASVGLVLLIACANLANLLLAAGTGRQREFAVRTSLGADRRRLVQQLLVESLVLSALGAAAGLGLASWVTRAASLLAAASIPRSTDVRVDGTVLAFAAIAAVVSAIPWAGACPASLHGIAERNPERGGRIRRAVPRRARDLFMAAQGGPGPRAPGGRQPAGTEPREAGVTPPGFSQARVTAMNVSLPMGRTRRASRSPSTSVRGAPSDASSAWNGVGDQHPAAQHGLRQPRHPGRGPAAARRPGPLAPGAVRDPWLLRHDGRAPHPGPAVRPARHRHLPAGGRHQRVDGPPALAGAGSGGALGSRSSAASHARRSRSSAVRARAK